jgi:Fe-S cluster assembly scaffold protein SufB
LASAATTGATREALRGLSREEARDRYRGLSLPTTTEEHWRFTDLSGFDPEAFDAAAKGSGARPGSILDIAAAGTAFASESGIEIVDAPEGIVFEPLRDHELLGSLVGADDKLAAQNAALWKHGLLVRAPKGVELSRPLYVRVSSSAEGGALFWRLLVVAEESSRFTLIEEYASESPDLAAYVNVAVELFVGKAAKLEYVSGTSPRTVRASSATGSSTGWPVASAPRRARPGSRTIWSAPGRPHASRAPTSPMARSTTTTTPFRSTRRRTRPPTSPSRERSATGRRRSGAA